MQSRLVSPTMSFFKNSSKWSKKNNIQDHQQVNTAGDNKTCRDTRKGQVIETNSSINRQNFGTQPDI